MGQKVNPHGLRVGVNKDWNSKWYAGKNDFADFLIEDQQIRNYVKKTLYAAGVASVVVERPAADKVRVVILAARPGMVIGRAGDGVEELKKSIVKMTGKTVEISIEEVRRSELDAQLTAESIAQALERRVSFRRAMKQAIQRTMKANAKGIKVLCSGRLGGAEIARSEKYSEGNVPLHTIRANIDYGFAEADTTYGKIGVKVWINQGEVLGKDLVSPVPEDTGKPDRKGVRRRQDGDRRDRNNRRDRRDRNNSRFEEKKAMPIQRRKLIKKEEPEAAQVETAAPQADEAPVEAAPATEE